MILLLNKGCHTLKEIYGQKRTIAKRPPSLPYNSVNHAMSSMSKHVRFKWFELEFCRIESYGIIFYDGGLICRIDSHRNYSSGILCTTYHRKSNIHSYIFSKILCYSYGQIKQTLVQLNFYLINLI
jgi:hypothetical protein